MIPIILSSTNHLFLTKAEVERLADHLHQQLTCRSINQADDLVMVADASMTVAEAWRLVDRLKDSIDEIVDWIDEGF